MRYLVERDDYAIAKDDADYGNSLILKSPWSRRFLKLVSRYKVKIITLNEYVWPDSDISFLLEIPGILEVNIVSDRVSDVSPVFRLKQLKSLSLHCKAVKVAGDFTDLTSLESLGLDWRNAYSSVLGLTNVTRICVLGYPETDLTVWGKNAKLKRLLFHSRRLECLSGLERFPNIRELKLGYCPRLASLDDVKSVKALERLNLYCCPRARDLSPISHLRNLKVLEIENCREIHSLAPVAKCKRLKRIQIAGNTTVLDGNMNYLTKLPHLKEVLLRRRKHYTHTGEELRKGLRRK